MKATIEKWQQWLQKDFPETGAYTIPAGLAPLQIDLSRNLGIYCEPNVWVRYRLD